MTEPRRDPTLVQYLTQTGGESKYSAHDLGTVLHVRVAHV